MKKKLSKKSKGYDLEEKGVYRMIMEVVIRAVSMISISKPKEEAENAKVKISKSSLN